jgi:hypothetical protein
MHMRMEIYPRTAVERAMKLQRSVSTSLRQVA